MKITREGPVKIGIKDIERAWRKRAKDARHIITDSERPGLALISNATSQTWSYSYKPRGFGSRDRQALQHQVRHARLARHALAH